MPPFLTTEAEKAVPVMLITEAEYAAWRQKQGEATRRWIDLNGFKARRDEVLTVPGSDGNIEAVALGLGPGLPAEGSPWPFARLASAVAAGTYRMASPLSPAAARLAALGWALQQYRFDRYRSNALESPPKVLVVPEGVDVGPLERLIDSIFTVRDLVNTPTSDLGPAEFATAVEEVARRHQARFTQIVGEELLDHDLGLIHAVGRASAQKPRLIDLTWGHDDAPKLTIVGKGVCFDTGGLDLKPSSSMRLMKKDMGGAAHALALARLVMENRLDVRLRLLIPAVENSIGGDAFRPGDVLRSRCGLTVEIDNTDAEGRLILADALTVADEDAPDLLIDFATLTGAARVALGPDIPPFFTDDEDLARHIAECARDAADPLWRLPLWDPYLDDLKSSIADISNSSSSGFAGCITAALFLKKFVSRARHWVHVDVFAWNKTSRPGKPAGGEAQGLRALYQLLEDRYR